MNYKSIKIEGYEFGYDDELTYVKEGHIYCKTCNEKLDGEPMIGFGGRKIVFRNRCVCVRKRKGAKKGVGEKRKKR